MLSDLGLSHRRKRNRDKGAARYLCYPEYSVFNRIANRVMELDFLGNKYIAARTQPLNFICFSFKKGPRLRYFRRVQTQTAETIIKEARMFFSQFEKPAAIKMDNGFAMAGTPQWPRVISKVPLWLLSEGIIPIYAVPRKPFSQASIEGNNSVFSRRFWNRIQFNNIPEVDEKLEWFNQSSQRYLQYSHLPSEPEEEGKFVPCIYFIRQVREARDGDPDGVVEIANDKISLPKQYINYFVLAKWDLKQEILCVYFEKEQKLKLIKKLSFPINAKSKKKLQKLLKI